MTRAEFALIFCGAFVATGLVRWYFLGNNDWDMTATWVVIVLYCAWRMPNRNGQDK